MKRRWNSCKRFNFFYIIRIKKMFHLFCASPLNIESEMIFTPFCIAEATSSHEYQLVNLMDDSTVSNETQITTVLPAMTFHSEKKSIDYEGNMYIFSCPMTAKDYDFYTQVIHWLEQETSTTIVNGKEYISSENGKKIHVFEVERRLKERYEIGGEFRNFNVKSAKTWVAMGLVGAKVAFILYKRQKYLESTRILTKVAENDEFTALEDIKDNVNIWKKFFISNINDAQIETALKTLKLDNYLNKKVGTLSFGETKKLEFLRLIIENKKVWILDEPLSNLDEDSIELMKQTFEDHSSKEGSIIFSSHQNPGIYVTEEIQL